MLSLAQSANLALSFLLELCALVAFGYWGARLGQSGLTALALGGGLPLAAAVFWGLFVAPRASVPLPAPLPFVLGLTILCLAAVSLAIAGQARLAWAMGSLVVLSEGLALAWGQ